MKTAIKTYGKHTAIALAISTALANNVVIAAEQTAEEEIEVISVRGMFSSLKRAMVDKKMSPVVSDGIAAEDLGKFPDLNVAESLQRITGISIDRSGGEGQAVTVRGFGPQFNTVLVNGRQLATDSSGREFNFDVLAADQITGADVYKTSTADLQEGGIGGTINVSTAKPFDHVGFQLVGSVKGVYESLSEEVSPAASVLISNTFADNTLGALLAVSHQKRDVQINRIETSGWRPDQSITVVEDGVSNTYNDLYIPRNWDQIVDNQERTRTNASLVLQYAPSDDVVITVDGFMSKFEVDSQANDLASWFEPDRITEAEIDQATGTVTSFNQAQGIGGSDPATDFVTHTRNSRDSKTDGYGIKVEWDITEQLTSTFDISNSTAENDRAGQDRFNVVGITNNYRFDSSGSTPTVIHDGFENGNLPDAANASFHYNEVGNTFTDEDEITEFKADFVYKADGDVFEQARFGAYRQEREKSSFQIKGSSCEAPFCSYATQLTADQRDFINFRPYTANNYFPGLIDTFYTFDGDKNLALIASDAVGYPVEPTLQGNRYTINEDISTLYMDFTFGFDLDDMPVSVNLGARYAQTSIQVGAVQAFISDVAKTGDDTLFENHFEDPINISGSDSYGNLLPSLNVKLEIQDDMILRFASYESMTRPTMSQLSPATTFNEPRRQNLTAQGGNPDLQPFTADNWDISYEWYYGNASFFTFALFHKEIDNYIITTTGAESYTLSDRVGPNYLCSTDNNANCADADVINIDELNGASEVYTVSRPKNSEDGVVTGFEVGITHIFDNGFGFIANATVVDSTSSEGFALEGLGDSQNLVGFYEADSWQARIAYNNRESFLRLADNGFNGEPVNTDTYGQWDISGSYDVDEHFTVFFEGINITKEELVQTGRFANQIYNIEDNGSRYAVGVRAKF